MEATNTAPKKMDSYVYKENKIRTIKNTMQLSTRDLIKMFGMKIDSVCRQENILKKYLVEESGKGKQMNFVEADSLLAVTSEIASDRDGVVNTDKKDEIERLIMYIKNGSPIKKDKKETKGYVLDYTGTGLNEGVINALMKFEKYRREKKKPMKQGALSFAVRQLKTYGKSEDEMIEMIERSIKKGWQGIFPLPDWRNNQEIFSPEFDRVKSCNAETTKDLKTGTYKEPHKTVVVEVYNCCPFCKRGDNVEMGHEYKGYFITCNTCGGRTGLHETREDALETWGNVKR